MGGYSSSFLCAKDLEEVGLVVRNIWDPRHRRSFYIAEKPFSQSNYDLYSGGFIEKLDIRELHFPGQVPMEDGLPGFIKEEKPLVREQLYRPPHRPSSLSSKGKQKQSRGWLGCCRSQKESDLWCTRTWSAYNPNDAELTSVCRIVGSRCSIEGASQSLECIGIRSASWCSAIVDKIYAC